MSGFLDNFRKKVNSSLLKEVDQSHGLNAIDDKIALGVLLLAVAKADNKFLPQEEEKIKEILLNFCKIPPEDIPCILASIEEAEKERIDFYVFTREIGKDLPYSVKQSIVESLFRLACIDNDLDNTEIETIRKISGLFNLAHKDFIDAKIKIKAELGLNTPRL